MTLDGQNIKELQDKIINEAISKVEILAGIDLVYFLDNNHQILKEKNNTNVHNYLQQILSIINNSKPLATDSKPFHTYTFLNENGLIILTKITTSENESLYMITIGGEHEPVDLINLLKICKETRLKLQNVSL